MNNDMPNNNSGNNDLNAVSLGNIGMTNNNPTVEPVENLEGLNSVPPVTPPVNADVNPVSPVEPVSMDAPVQSVVTPPVDTVQPVGEVPSIDAMSGGVIPPVDTVAPVSYDIPESINNFSTTPIFNEIGTVPPIADIPVQNTAMNTEEVKPKKKTNKLIFVIIIVLLITAVGVGVYIFLSISNKPASVSVTPKAVSIEVGSEVSTNILDYADFNGVNSANCSLNTSNITDTSVLGNEYNFSITCGADTYNGKATIVDTTAPSAVSKDVKVEVNGTVSPQDFISSCTDATDCAYAFSDANQVNEYIKTAGEYTVDIIVTDEAGNRANVTANLVVTADEIPDFYLTCSKDNEILKLAIKSSTFTGSATRSYTFTFSSADEYNSFKTQYGSSNSVTYQNITGTPTFSDDDLTITLTQNLTKADLEGNGTSLPTTYGELRQYYTSQGYSCEMGF